MKYLLAIVLLFVPLLFSCRARLATVETSEAATRHSDSVAALCSIRATLIERETVVETITVRPDTITGTLRVVAKDITKTTERATETAKTGDTARFSISDKKTINQESETHETQGNAATRQPVGYIALWWLCIAVLAVLFVLYLHATWKSRNL